MPKSKATTPRVQGRMNSEGSEDLEPLKLRLSLFEAGTGTTGI
jgi:hypothetical protein